MEDTISLPPLLPLVRTLQFPKKLGILESLYGNTLAAHGTSWVECSNGVVWKLDLSDPTHRWIVYGDYEGGLGLSFGKQVLSRGGVFVDSGSNIGQWALYLGGLPNVQALLFEPVATQRQWLTSCLQRQHGWNCTTYPLGLGSENGTVDIQCDGARSTIRSDWYQHKKLMRESIQIRRLDDVLKDAGISDVQLWKLDVEGGEYEALLGAGEYLGSHRIKHLYFECHSSNYKRCGLLLRKFGYQIYTMGRAGLSLMSDEGITTTQDLIALPRR